MGLYNFQERFEDGIRTGRIQHTIRGPRFYGRQRMPGVQDGVGDVMHLYAGMRTKACRLLGRFVCAAVEQIRIAKEWRLVGGKEWHKEFVPAIWINGEMLSPDESEDFARRDGFKSFAAFQRYWCMSGDLPFEGFVLHWDFERPVKVRAVCAPKRKRPTSRKGVRSVTEARHSEQPGPRRSTATARSRLTNQGRGPI